MAAGRATFRCHPFVVAGARRGSCAGLRRIRSSHLGVSWSRARARACSAFGSGTPPRGPSSEGRDGAGPVPPPPSDSEGPGDGSERRYSRPGTNIKAMTPTRNNNVNNPLPAPSSGSDSTRWRATPTRTAIKAGRARAAKNARTQKCDRLCRPEPTAIHSATRKGSKTTTVMITKLVERSTGWNGIPTPIPQQAHVLTGRSGLSGGAQQPGPANREDAYPAAPSVAASGGDGQAKRPCPATEAR